MIGGARPSFGIPGPPRRCRGSSSYGPAWPRVGSFGEASVTAKTIPRHARTFERQRWVPRPREGRLPGLQTPGIPKPRLPDGRVRADPLAGPVAITERAVLGDRIRRPTAWCEMAA